MSALPITQLPTMADVGTRRTWYLPLGRGRTDQRHQVDATFIGMGSSVQHQHRHHDPGASFARTDQRCGACRWFETRIFRVVTPPSDEPDHRARTEYVLHHVGASIVPGEVDLHRHELVYSAHEVIEAFTVRRVTDGHPSEPFMTRPAARALAMAAGYDRQLELAYVDRATA